MYLIFDVDTCTKILSLCCGCILMRTVESNDECGGGDSGSVVILYSLRGAEGDSEVKPMMCRGALYNIFSVKGIVMMED